MNRLRMKSGKILIIEKVHPILKEKLRDLGFDCIERVNISYKQLKTEIIDCKGVIVRSRLYLGKDFFDAAANLVFVGRIGSGLENIDTEYAETLGIRCVNSPEGNRDAVGEHALGLLLALMKNICKADKEIKEGRWLREQNRGFEIMGRTVGIIGYGNTGSAFAQRLAGFKANVIAYDKYKSGFGDQYVVETTMEDIFKKTDILSLHVPLTIETRYMVSTSFLEKFQKSIYIVNTSRGQILDTAGLATAIKNKKVMGAALDVLEYESDSFETIKPGKKPEPFKYLLKSDKVVLSPHVAGVTFESQYKLAEVLYRKIESLFN